MIYSKYRRKLFLFNHRSVMLIKIVFGCFLAEPSDAGQSIVSGTCSDCRHMMEEVSDRAQQQQVMPAAPANVYSTRSRSPAKEQIALKQNQSNEKHEVKRSY